MNRILLTYIILLLIISSAYEKPLHAKKHKPIKVEKKSAVTLRKKSERRHLSPLSLKWPGVHYAIRYRVQVKDHRGTIIVDKETVKTEITFMVHPGKYMIRIGAITPFEKLASWSEWDSFTVKSRLPCEKVGFYVSPGMTYSFYMPPLNSEKGDVFPGALLTLGIFGTKGAGRWHGGEMELAYFRHSGTTFLSTYNRLTGGLNYVFTTRFNFPLNLALRLGGGISYTFFNSSFPTQTMSSSLDYYAAAGIALDWAFYKDYFLQLGLDYHGWFLQNSVVDHSLRIRLAAGYRPGWGTNWSWKGTDEKFSDKEGKKPKIGFKIGAGYTILHTLPLNSWAENFSFLGGTLQLGLYGKYGILKWFGLTAEGSFQEITTTGTDAALHRTILAGASLRIATPFDFPLNAVVRLGGGMLITYVSNAMTTFWSLDTYYKGALGMEITILGSWYAELGVEYLYLLYQDSPRHSLRYYVMTGVKL
jgi:hypothetical protein